eukprot:TRINITY_DN6791_c0_g1_i1.p1 TRINITY_DN6791_c0_g1~~TRINITY_DN6791_c0_g1_i1.p1  ORF type:complete len:260 (+),score=81.56 TRINITY_DN6791_c0_g1_i1:85-864(+)
MDPTRPLVRKLLSSSVVVNDKESGPQWKGEDIPFVPNRPWSCACFIKFQHHVDTEHPHDQVVWIWGDCSKNRQPGLFLVERGFWFSFNCEAEDDSSWDKGTVVHSKYLPPPGNCFHFAVSVNKEKRRFFINGELVAEDIRDEVRFLPEMPFKVTTPEHNTSSVELHDLTVVAAEIDEAYIRREFLHLDMHFETVMQRHLQDTREMIVEEVVARVLSELRPLLHEVSEEIIAKTRPKTKEEIKEQKRKEKEQKRKDKEKK